MTSSRARGAAALGLLLVAAACSHAIADNAASDNADLVDDPNASVLDQTARSELAADGFTADETQAVADSIVISKMLGLQSWVDEANKGYKLEDSSIRRESHGKGQGCVRAKFEVTNASGNGIFKEGASYPAWIRLSNGGQYQKSDKSPHISRGWGVKLLGVDDAPSGVQDFLFITSPRFFIHDITHYPSFLKSSGDGRLGFILNTLFGLSAEEKAVIAHRMLLKTANLLDTSMYSAVPYAYGSEAVKYALAPCGKTPLANPLTQLVPPFSSDDYLEDAMNATLAEGDACYSFFVQKPRSEELDPIDNPTTAWEGDFEEVAKITIPAGQQVGGPADYKNSAAECERMAFDPWNATPASLPRGKTNITRKFVYSAMSQFRRVDMPAIYAKWQANHDNPSIPASYKTELAKLRDPSALAPRPKTTEEPSIDDGFRALGIVP